MLWWNARQAATAADQGGARPRVPPWAASSPPTLQCGHNPAMERAPGRDSDRPGRRAAEGATSGPLPLPQPAKRDVLTYAIGRVTLRRYATRVPPGSN